MPTQKKKPTVISEQNKNRIVRHIYHDSHGRFIKGNLANPSGRNGLLGIDELVDALNNEALRKKFPDFNAYVAHRAFTNNQVLIAVMKKIYPDKVEHSGRIILTQEEKDVRFNRLKTLGVLSLN